MKGKTTLKRLKRALDSRQTAPDDFAESEQAKLDAMTDEELARHVEILAAAVELLNAARTEP